MNPKTMLTKKIVWHNQHNEKRHGILSNSAMYIGVFKTQVPSMQLQHKVKNRVLKATKRYCQEPLAYPMIKEFIPEVAQE